jgi:Methyltransferase domain
MTLANRTWRYVGERFRRTLVVWHLRVLQLLYRKRPVPLRYWLFFRSAIQRICRSPNPLLPMENFFRSTGASLPVEELKKLLCHDSLGAWALDGDTISFLWKGMQQDRPKIIIECGSGVSTLVLAKSVAAYRFEPANCASVLSIEQDAQVKKATEARLETSRLTDHVKIFHAPISERGDYQLDALREHLGSEKVEWLVIDGPAGPDGCRASTLTSLARFCRPGARWFLDDAFRDGELQILNQWDRMSGIVVEGIYPIGKGLAAGIVTDPQQVARYEISYR